MSKIKCAACGYEGEGKSISRITAILLLLLVFILTGVMVFSFFIKSSQVVITSFVIMFVLYIWMNRVSKDRSCPKCGSKDTEPVESAGTDEAAGPDEQAS